MGAAESMYYSILVWAFVMQVRREEPRSTECPSWSKRLWELDIALEDHDLRPMILPPRWATKRKPVSHYLRQTLPSWLTPGLTRSHTIFRAKDDLPLELAIYRLMPS
jgi:hypothetical protein